MEEDDDNSNQKKDVFEKVDENGREHFVNVLDIVGKARHQLSHRVLVKKGDRKSLEMGENLQPKVVHHPLPRRLHGIDLKEIQSEMEAPYQDDEESNVKDSFDIFIPKGKKIIPVQTLHPVDRDSPARTAPLKEGG